MAIILDHQLREQIPCNNEFPITYFHDELALLPYRAGPLHWHPEFEIATSMVSALDFQLGQEHILLDVGDSIFINGNIIHGIRQLHGELPDPMPNIVFSSSVVASESSLAFQKYMKPIAACDSLPFVIFKSENENQREVNLLIKEIYQVMNNQSECYELVVQRNLNRIFEYIFRNFETLPKSQVSQLPLSLQCRLYGQILLFIPYPPSASARLLHGREILFCRNRQQLNANRSSPIYNGNTPKALLLEAKN